MEEITAQASYETQDRFIYVDPELYSLAPQPSPWGDVDFALSLPLPVLQHLLRAGFDPSNEADRRAYARARARAPLLTVPELAMYTDRAGSLSASLDNVPARATRRGTGGILIGEYNVLAQTDVGVDSLVLDAVQLGIYKHKGPRHLYGSYRPVTMESAIIRDWTGIGRGRLNESLEVAAAYTPDVFSYRTAILPQFLTLVCRAGAVAAFQSAGEFWDGDWDESDAFLREPRDACAPLMAALPDVWNFGAWADQVYSHLRIHPVTSEGLAPPFRTGEGRNQGDSFAGEGFQATQCLINSCFARQPGGLTIPNAFDLHSPPLPCDRVMFVDDRHFLGGSLRAVTADAATCSVLSTGVGRIVHPSKLQFHGVRLTAGGLHAISTHVPFSDKPSSTQPPAPLKIPLLHDLPMTAKISKLLQLIRSVSAAALRPDHHPILQLRALHVHALSACDYVWRGVHFPCLQLAAMQASVDKHYWRVFGLPSWAPRRFLRLPLTAGGPQSPDLFTRAALLLASTYYAASWGRNPLAASAARYLLEVDDVAGWAPEGAVMRRVWLPLGLDFVPLPSPSVSPMVIHSTGSLDPLPALEYVVVAIDGGLLGSRLSGGLAAWHPSLGVFYRAWWGLRAYQASATDAEWVAKTTAMLLLPPTATEVYMVSDASGAQHLNLTRGPTPFSVLNVLYRKAIARWGACPPKEIWLRAGHNTDSQAQLTQLNREAHDLACRGRHEARAYTAPWLPLLHGRVAAFWTGQLIVDVSAFESMQSDSAQAGSLPRLQPPPSPPAHAAFVAAFLAGSVPRLALRRVYALRLLDRRHPPAALTALRCPFCDGVVEDLVVHLRAACWHYLGFVVSALGAVCWLDGVRRQVQGPAQHPAYWVAVPDGVVGLWDSLHPGVAAPPERHALVSMTAEIFGADDEDKAMVTELLHVLSRPVMRLSHLLWRATAVDHAVNAGCERRPGALTYRQSALLGMVVRVLPR